MPEYTSALPVSSAESNFGVVLEVVDGPDRGLHVAIGTDEVWVGASEACGLQLTDPTVSRRHLAVRRTALGARFEDTGSRNGTWLGDALVKVVELPLDVELRVGSSMLRLKRAEGTSAGARDNAAIPVESFGRFLGRAPELQSLYRVLRKVAASDTAVLLEGESGSGKELLAEAIHEHSSRSNAPLNVVDCGSLPPTLIESELFGHVKGAFTGATQAHKGVFEAAHGGTLFLDEVGELPLELQTRLLRTLDRGQVRRVGSKEWINVDLRIVAATNRNVEREVEEGRFRLDLYHRLGVVHLRVPPLRERSGDIALLAAHFAALHGSEANAIVAEILRRGTGYHWPGNVRELRNHVERLALLGEDAPPWTRTVAHGGDSSADVLQDIACSGEPYRTVRARALSAVHRAYVANMLERCDGNVSKAAKAAGVARRHFYRLRDDGD